MAPSILASDEDWTEYLYGKLKQFSNQDHAKRTVFDLPYEILPHLLLGNKHNAEYIEQLEELGVTHILNCAEGDKNLATNEEYYKKHDGFTYKGFQAEDSLNYDMKQHIDAAIEFIDAAKEANGKVLVHCVEGINRSGLIVIAYCMQSLHWTLSKAFEHCAKIRVVILHNQSFQKQLVQWGREHGLLYRRAKLASLMGSQAPPKKKGTKGSPKSVNGKRKTSPRKSLFTKNKQNLKRVETTGKAEAVV